MDSKIDAISEKWAADTIVIKPSSPVTIETEPLQYQDQQELLQIKPKPTLTDILMRPALPVQLSRRKAIPTKLMVDAAIKSQMTTRRSGVSLIAIKKYIAQNYQAANIDVNNRAKYIKRYIMSALENGKLERTKGVGVSGSFRLPLSESKLQKTIEKSKNNKQKRGKNLRALKTLKRLRGATGSGGGTGGGKHLMNSVLVNPKSGRGTNSRGGALTRRQ